MTHQDNLNQAILGIASKKASTDSSQSRHLEKMGTRYSGRGSSHYQYTFPNEQNQLTVPGYVAVNPAANLISQYLAKLIKPKKKTKLRNDPDKADQSFNIYNKSRQIVADLDIENYKLDPIGLKPGDLGYDRNFADSVLLLRQINATDAAKKSKELEVPSIEKANESTTERHMNNIIKNKIKNQCYKVLSEYFGPPSGAPTTGPGGKGGPGKGGPGKGGPGKGGPGKGEPGAGGPGKGEPGAGGPGKGEPGAGGPGKGEPGAGGKPDKTVTPAPKLVTPVVTPDKAKEVPVEVAPVKAKEVPPTPVLSVPPTPKNTPEVVTPQEPKKSDIEPSSEVDTSNPDAMGQISYEDYVKHMTALGIDPQQGMDNSSNDGNARQASSPVGGGSPAGSGSETSNMFKPITFLSPSLDQLANGPESQYANAFAGWMNSPLTQKVLRKLPGGRFIAPAIKWSSFFTPVVTTGARSYDAIRLSGRDKDYNFLGGVADLVPPLIADVGSRGVGRVVGSPLSAALADRPLPLPPFGGPRRFASPLDDLQYLRTAPGGSVVPWKLKDRLKEIISGRLELAKTDLPQIPSWRNVSNASKLISGIPIATAAGASIWATMNDPTLITGNQTQGEEDTLTKNARLGDALVQNTMDVRSRNWTINALNQFQNPGHAFQKFQVRDQSNKPIITNPDWRVGYFERVRKDEEDAARGDMDAEMRAAGLIK